MERQIRKFGTKIWNSEHRKFGEIPLQNVISQMCSADAWGEKWPIFWHLELQNASTMDDYGSAHGGVLSIIPALFLVRERKSM